MQLHTGFSSLLKCTVRPLTGDCPALGRLSSIGLESAETTLVDLAVPRRRSDFSGAPFAPRNVSAAISHRDRVLQVRSPRRCRDIDDGRGPGDESATTDDRGGGAYPGAIVQP